MTIEIVIFGAVMMGVAAGLLLEKLRPRLEAANAEPGQRLRLLGPAAPAARLPAPPPRADSMGQLRLVSDARFAAKPLVSNSVAGMMADIEALIADAGIAWRVMAQVSLAEIVASNDAEALAALDGQRVDLLIVDAGQMPVAVAEYQQLGQLRDDDAVRAAVRREALRRANIAYLEVRSSDSPGILRADFAVLAARYAARSQ